MPGRRSDSPSRPEYRPYWHIDECLYVLNKKMQIFSDDVHDLASNVKQQINTFKCQVTGKHTIELVQPSNAIRKMQAEGRSVTYFGSLNDYEYCKNCGYIKDL